jgi:outer membrane protein OmpA-like peptidoglycan-associated protein
MALSLRRANFVAGQLIKRGIPKWKLHIQGFGKRMPIVRNAQTEEEHAKNRRVVVDVVKR